MEIEPIRDDAGFHAMSRAVGDALDRGVEPGSRDYRDVEIMLALMRDWEARARPVAWPDPIFTITAIMEERGLTRADLAGAIGSRARVSEILNKDRRLTLDMINRLVTLLDVPADALVRPYALRRAREGGTATRDKTPERTGTPRRRMARERVGA